jgi:DNA replication protein DnaC
MKYIVDTIVNLILNNAPTKDGEMMVRVDCFEDIKIYETVSRELYQYFNNENLTVNIKLAKNKWRHFKQTSYETQYLQSMEQNGWIADDESITRYRNLHDSNVLILMGTEDEEDKGGLLNCYTITPDILSNDLEGNYYNIFAGELDFTEVDIACVNKLYRDLFEFIAMDICKLSNLIDSWNNKINTLTDFIELFYESLPVWGLPFKKLVLPTAKDLKSKSNILRVEHNFISRQLFKKMSKSQYTKYKKQIDLYEEEGGEYSSNWTGWDGQGIKSYKELANVILGYSRGERISEYKERLIKTDFSIIEAILDIKISKPAKARNTIPVVTGEPLEAFADALLQMLCMVKETGLEVSVFEFSILQAEVVSMYSDNEDEDSKVQLKNTWQNICRHTNGVFEYLNRNIWYVNDESVDIQYTPERIFSPVDAVENIENGYVKAASPNKTINKIDFSIICKNTDGTIVKYGNKQIAQQFQWKFNSSEAWLHNFSDICIIEDYVYSDGKYIPLVVSNKITSLLFAKSEEEFFDIYDESDMRFDFDLIKYIDEHVSLDTKVISAKFDQLGKKFVKFVYEVMSNGFYSCICKEQSELVDLVDEYAKLGDELSRTSFPENQKWILDAFIHAFNIEESTKVLSDDNSFRCCVVPTWHPAALEKINDQKIFFLDGCAEWWSEQEYAKKLRKKEIKETIDNLNQMSMIQSSLDIFPSYGQTYFGAVNSFGTFSVYGRSDIKNNSRLKDMIHKDAIYDDDFDSKENVKMNDNAKMIYGVLADYIKAFPNSYNNLSIVFVDPSELQPIVAAIYKFIDVEKQKHNEGKINISLKILVKPENKGGRNYLAYWMDECFSQDANVSIKTYLNEWSSKFDIDKLLNGNNDIIFVMDLLKVNNLQFVKESGAVQLNISECRFPIVFKPSPVSDTSSNVKRKIELSQPQFSCSYAHTQVSRYRNNSETIPDSKFIAVREVCIDSEAQSIVYALHEKAYWVVCVDSGMDGALLRNNEQHPDEYSIIGFSTGKGAYGQYNLTITARKPILDTIQKKLENRLYQLFKWEKQKVNKAASLCVNEASGLDGISLLSAINQRDHNVNEFMAYVLTSLREKEISNGNINLKILIHLDSYKHWFSGEIELDESDSHSRPDFLILEVVPSDGDKLNLRATVTECKISTLSYATHHKENAYEQVKHGIKRLSTIFNPNSKSIKRRYWYAQLYRALAFAQVTFSDNSSEFAEMSSKLRSILDGNFEVEWNGEVLGYWLDMDGDCDVETRTDEACIKIYDIPQKRIQYLLLKEDLSGLDYVDIDNELIEDEEERELLICERENELKEELKINNKRKKARILYDNVSYIRDFETSKVADYEPFRNDNEGPKVSIDFENAQNGTELIDNESQSFENSNTNIDNSKLKYSSGNAMSLDSTRVLIGKDRISEEVYWEFGNKQLANRHLLITGTSGQGKTYSIQSMLYELSKSNVSSVIFDYTEGFRLDQLEKEFVDKMGNHIHQRIVKFENVPINPFKRQYIEFAGSKFPEKDPDIAARFANILTHVYGLGDQQSAAIFDAVRIGLSKHGDDMNMRYFQDELENEKQFNKSAQTVISKMQPFFYSIEFEEDNSFDWGDVIYPNESSATIFQLTAIDRDMQVIITELMLWDLWYYSTKNGNKDKPFVVVLDEAQNLSHKDKSPSCKILTEGRKFGWSAWYATQSLNVLDDDEVTRLLQSAFKLYFKPTDSEIVKMSKQLDPTDGSTWLTALKGLKKGQCIAVGERMKKDGKFGLVKPTITSVSPFNERS